MYVQETWIDRTDDCLLGEGEVYESFTDNVGELFKSLQKESGKCIGKLHLGHKGEILTIGWVFLRKEKYTDCNKTYLRETWVTLHDELPKTTTEYFYHTLD